MGAATALIGAPSIAAAFPGEKFTQPQYRLLARLTSGEDLRAWQLDSHAPLYALIHRRVIDVEATTGRLYLLTAAMIEARRAQLAERIAQAEREVEELDALIEIGGRVLLSAIARDAEAADTLRHLIAAPSAASTDIAAARAARSESVIDLSEQRSADQRRRERLAMVADELRDLRREGLRLDLAAQRRQRAEGGQS